MEATDPGKEVYEGEGFNTRLGQSVCAPGPA
jgi:hypothetical protein